MQKYETREMAPGVRVRWIYDDLYETVGSYAYETEEETREAEAWELERLADGRLVALGAIVEHECSGCGCPHCTGWHPLEVTYMNGNGSTFRGPQDLWGIVIEPDGDKLDEFARATFDLTPPTPDARR